MGLETLGIFAAAGSGTGAPSGAGFITYLERLLGRSPDPRPQFQPPELFQHRLELPAEVGKYIGLLFAARRLILNWPVFSEQGRPVLSAWRILFHGNGRRAVSNSG